MLLRASDACNQGRYIRNCGDNLHKTNFCNSKVSIPKCRIELAFYTISVNRYKMYLFHFLEIGNFENHNTQIEPMKCGSHE